jgi:hypothetical protein
VSDEVWWTRCEKCGELLTRHTSLAFQPTPAPLYVSGSSSLVCPKPKPAVVRPLRPGNQT